MKPLWSDREALVREQLPLAVGLEREAWLAENFWQLDYVAALVREQRHKEAIEFAKRGNYRPLRKLQQEGERLSDEALNLLIERRPKKTKGRTSKTDSEKFEYYENGLRQAVSYVDMIEDILRAYYPKQRALHREAIRIATKMFMNGTDGDFDRVDEFLDRKRTRDLLQPMRRPRRGGE